jgi:nucleotide-binding universal stress UspA family protein
LRTNAPKRRPRNRRARKAIVDGASGEERDVKSTQERPISSTVVVDSPRDAIVEEAERRGADLIVVGSHGYRGPERALLGSVSQAVATQAKCSVEIARRQMERHGLSATLMITEGDPALEILSEAERGEYDLIVIGATGEDDLKHDLLGSVSTKVTQAALCSTLVVKL